MNKSVRYVNTPRVEIGSPQYEADSALMKLFDSYYEYLSYVADWQKPWTSFHPSIATTNAYPTDFCCEPSFMKAFDSYYEDYLNAMRINCTCNSVTAAFFLRQFVDYEEYLSFLSYIYSDYGCLVSEPIVIEGSNKDMARAHRREHASMHHRRSAKKSRVNDFNDATIYKRARILQPQCISLEVVRFVDKGHTEAILSLFDSHEDYLDYLADCYGSNEPVAPDFSLEINGLRISQHSSKCFKRERLSMEGYDARVENSYELHLIGSALPGISERVAKNIRQLIYGYLESNGEKSEGDSLLDYLIPLVRPDMKKGISSVKKVQSLGCFSAYAEVKRLVELVKFMIPEDSGISSEESEPIHHGKKPIPTSAFFPKAPDSNEQEAEHISAYVNRRSAGIGSSEPVNVSLKETPVHLIMERPMFICNLYGPLTPAFSRFRPF